ncbi:MAG: ATP-binding cassette domain-containing protein [Spirochaetales bacterium]|nr:ATP-binding cassette domain-containing protein [Spirochaetales bacterium]
MENMLEIKDLGKNFRIHDLNKKISACQGINLTLKEGEFIGITGRSGSGKSTILKMIYRTYLPDEGEIRYNSAQWGLMSLSEAEERQVLYLRKYELGYVSQFLDVLPRMSARSIIEQAVLEMGKTLEEAREETVRMLSHFELDETLWDSYAATFSGGEKLRLNIARAMVKHPRLLLLDEPTASLDNHSKIKVRQLIEQLKAEGTTMLGIFHDIEFMEGLCDREFSMQKGRVVA